VKDLIIPCEINVRVHDEFVLINSTDSIIVGVEFGFNNIMEYNDTVDTGIQCNATHQHLNLHSEMLLVAVEDREAFNT
jgi:hypothetical protein